jgi:ribonuclease R
MSKKTSKKDPFAAREAAKYERPIPSREFILAHLKQRGAPANYTELLLELSLETEEEQEALHRRIKAMIRDGELESLRKGYVWPAGQRTVLKGRVQVEKGKINRAWVVPDDGSARVSLPFKESQAVFQGNYVVVSVLELEGEHPIREGNLVEILEQGRLVVTGRFVQEPGVSYVIPHGKEFTQDILIPVGDEKGAQEGHIVVVEIRREPSRWSELIGRVIDILGHENTAGIEIQAATRAYGLPEEWSEDVLKEISGLKETVPAAAKKGRLDLSHIPLITIDGEDARDFDDAVYCEAKPNGGWTLYVAIADVSYYVKPHSALDKSAKERGNSVYFPGKVIPMLPEVLSNGLCSLNPNVERLCMVCVLRISNKGKITGYQFHEAIMQSAARLTYTKVATLLKGEDEKLAEQYAAVLPHIQALYELYGCLKTAREERGAIEFETSETRVIFGENGKISRIEPVQRNEAHRIIEECMLCANVATARFLSKHKLPGLYRIHESPPPDKLADLTTFLGELGLVLGGGKEPTPIDYARLLRAVQDRSDANIIQLVLLRSLSQAVYSPDNTGHFGLAYPAYCHFTSPIRRYPDLVTHRQIRAVLRGEWTEKDHAPLKEGEETLAALTALGVHTSMTERRADEATRDVLRWLKCEYIQKHIGDVFDGVVSGVTRFGFFVELKDLYIDGLVHVTSLRNDYYFFDNIHHRLVGERSGVIFKLGDSVKVKVTTVDIDQRRIDFDLIAPLAPLKTKKSTQSEKPNRKKKPRSKKKSVDKKSEGSAAKRTKTQESVETVKSTATPASANAKPKKRRRSRKKKPKPEVK